MKRSKRLYLGSYVFRPDLQMPRPNVRAFIALQHKNDIINWNEKKKSREWKWLFCLLITSWRESVPASSSLTKESRPLIFFLPKKLSIKNSARLLLYTLLYLVFHWLPCLPTHRQHRLQNPKARMPCFRWKFLLEIKLVNAHILPQKLLFRTSIFLKLPTLCSLFFSATWARCLSEN